MLETIFTVFGAGLCIVDILRIIWHFCFDFIFFAMGLGVLLVAFTFFAIGMAKRREYEARVEFWKVKTSYLHPEAKKKPVALKVRYSTPRIVFSEN